MPPSDVTPPAGAKPRKPSVGVLRGLVFGLALCGASLVTAAETGDLPGDARLILSDRCFKCHGPDAGSREADLRLDTAEGAADAVASGELLRRVMSDDEYEVMPPPDSKIELSPAEKATLVKWVASGATYRQHWAFEDLPSRVEAPDSGPSEWPRGEIDRFVLARLHAAGFEPSPEAKPAAWFRRVCFDLTGLPPTAAQLDEFRASLTRLGEKAYGETVDRLLAKPAYGEQMAVAWLDAARYADSYGYQSDKLNTQWPYRDWVVRAFNENLPYDDFLIWQLAGDLLPNATRDQRLATAFNRLHRLNNEGGAVFEEWRIENVSDRVHTYGTAVLGLTMECCRCHDHKYDPISQRDYFALSAFFNSIDESGLYDRTEKVPAPSMLLPTASQEQELNDAEAAMVDAEVAQSAAIESARERYRTWRIQAADDLSLPNRTMAMRFDGDFAVEGEQPDELKAAVSTNNREPTDGLSFVDSAGRQAVAFDGERGVNITGVPDLDRWTPFTFAMTLRDKLRTNHQAVLAHQTQGTDAGYNGWDLTIEAGHVASRMYRVWPGNAIGVRSVEPIPQSEWVHVTATYDGSSQAAGLRLFLNGRELAVTVVRDGLKKKTNGVVGHRRSLVVGQRFRDRGFEGGLVDDVALFQRALSETEVRSLATDAPLEPSFEYFCSAIDPACRRASAELTEARQRFVLGEETVQEVPVMEEMDEPRPAYVLARGQYDSPKNDETLVERGAFASILPPFPESEPLDRLGLARWTVSDDHPLTARVAVNRLWANFFGAGLVTTPENFGSQGALPTDQSLLDWLARDFVDHGWDMKRLCRKIVLSAAYRQSSYSTPELIAADPKNALLTRGPAFRLSAEQIRDAALSASGLLNTARGGPPISPYQPGGDLWKESNAMSPPYEQSVGKALYRRSLYSVWKRTAPLPNMLAFDAGSRETCVVARSRTNTPLQALVLLNDVQFIEACRALATRAFQDHPSDSLGERGRIASCFTAFTGRAPTDDEAALLARLQEQELAYYRSHPGEAAKLLRLGDLPVREGEDPAELAAMTIVCQAILNLDATVWRR
ncbi:Planctomycete cytochrome C [Botrimarina colliarenosi]|uniref:Planctomycete cytochrome C n=1 Tax=Botrimarina colliarenosi TaxID=2528001 RepID=A0A5C6AF86_9BACT|nr:DUF1553 domain-containing protein [Botrimarina colliarenosi]TWT97721.1 Planctomycete cytochrome C [Botrimarina colliarenosi]